MLLGVVRQFDFGTKFTKARPKTQRKAVERIGESTRWLPVPDAALPPRRAMRFPSEWSDTMISMLKRATIATTFAAVLAAPLAFAPSPADAQVRIVPQSESNAATAERRGEIREDRAIRRGEQRANIAESRGNYRQADQIRQKADQRADRAEDRAEAREDRAYYNNRDGYVAQNPYRRDRYNDDGTEVHINLN
ncbi:hypothetical protein L1787_22885 [Acuticoccus sp. M5D2P5]|uniref:hypothetical protein n=1 Tax=Acuticoccus kalidii TaxID=2910977 RepID=UPI001F1F4D8A|nr:hypothetical protein [Acuticoccus kalidii]MCF3936242.1 hypothetical protein [Acuticoccus kalidii]